MSGLLSRLGAAGIPTSFARKVLPQWWDDEVAAEPAGLQQAQLYFARAFNIELQSLSERNATPRFRSSVRKFKMSRNVCEDDVTVSAHYATAMAKIALRTHDSNQGVVPSDPAKLRASILNTQSCVSLKGLLAWCVKSSIPVIHIQQLPGKKMTGLVVREGGRFAIVLSKMGHPAHLLFHLAHELGHIANGHLSEDGFVADESIGTISDDADEKEADAYAIRLINGGEAAYRAAGTIKSGGALYKAAVKKGREEGVDVGHIILNFGHNQAMYALAAVALKSVSGPTKGNEVINSAFFENLDAEALSEDQLWLLKAATGYSA